MAGDRYNTTKPRMDLLPWDVLLELADHYRVGAAKYADRNWEKGLKWNEGTAASLARHLAAWSTGEDIDPENGQFHDLAILWNACALVAYRLRNVGIDDRPKKDTTIEKDTTCFGCSRSYAQYPCTCQYGYQPPTSTLPGCPDSYNGPTSPTEGATEAKGKG